MIDKARADRPSPDASHLVDIAREEIAKPQLTRAQRLANRVLAELQVSGLSRAVAEREVESFALEVQRELWEASRRRSAGEPHWPGAA